LDRWSRFNLLAVITQGNLTGIVHRFSGDF